ncbi:MAG TPA: isochorismatase family protein [Candidatus Avipropionibacterium avicola]|uniref:Isochorismatase family protein n=1 Tax=Candidatus Avipropionibacterium avicola TaxID=2840701 RepID=A0A9D1KPJ0_9ACTN|nr:isochorismatase family protein [Candidatus Avipropionibacterium avicola]
MSDTPTPRRALVLVDVQLEYVTGRLTIDPPVLDAAMARIMDLIEVAEQQQVPIVVVRHESPAAAPLLAAGSPGAQLHPEVVRRRRPGWLELTKRWASVLDDTDLADWCARNSIDTLSLVGFMANNCLLATAAGAAPYGLAVEVVSDATATLGLRNAHGSVGDAQLHQALMVLLHSNFAAVSDSATWAEAVRRRVPTPRSSLLASIPDPAGSGGSDQDGRDRQRGRRAEVG